MLTTETEIRGTIPLRRLRECPFNPRKHSDDGQLRELAASMTQFGCLQPLLARPVPATATVGPDGEWVGLKHLEIAAGHRRFRAAKLARLPELPVTVRVLTDTQMRAIMLVENINREDLRPSEEAVSLADLVATLGLEAAAEKVGKPESVVRERAALAGLPVWFLAAVDAALVPVSTAGVVARVPGEESRERAAVCVAAGLDGPAAMGDDWRAEWFDESGEDGPTLRCDYLHVLTQREAKELVRTHFCRELKGAPFSRKAVDLVPEAGSCDACPKRAGNDPDLLADGVRGDTCTDPECYAKKVAAYRAAEGERFGRRWEIAGPITPVEEPFRGEQPPRGYCDLDAKANGSELGDGFQGDPTVLDLIGRVGGAVSNPVPKLLAFDARGKPRTLVRTAELKKRLVRAGVLRRPEVEKRVPLGDEVVSLRPKGKEPEAAPRLFHLTNVTADGTDMAFEVAADATEAEIAEAAFEAVCQHLSYGWKEQTPEATDNPRPAPNPTAGRRKAKATA